MPPGQGWVKGAWRLELSQMREGAGVGGDWVAAAAQYVGTAAVVLWQNSRLTVLWDLSYVLDGSWRIALGQVPYRDFPFVHPPITFLIQAALMRVAGSVFFHHVLYAAVVGGLGTVVAWRIVLEMLRGRWRARG